MNTSKVKTIEEEILNNSRNDEVIINRIIKKDVYNCLRLNGFDPSALLYTRKMTFLMVRKFNLSIKKTSKKINMPMHEILLMLEEDYTTINFLMSVLNDRNKQIIRNECKNKYNINDDDCALFDILS